MPMDTTGSPFVATTTSLEREFEETAVRFPSSSILESIVVYSFKPPFKSYRMIREGVRPGGSYTQFSDFALDHGGRLASSTEQNLSGIRNVRKVQLQHGIAIVRPSLSRTWK